LAVHSIRQLGDPVLRLKAKQVTKIDGSIQLLIEDMIESMQAASGVGLAAPQIGASLRVIVIGLPEEEPFALINPKIVKRSGHRLLEEGCLSVAGYRAEITRSRTVIAKGLDRHGKPMRIKAVDNLLAQALEHEVDHINGVLYIDSLESLDQLQKVEVEQASTSGG